MPGPSHRLRLWPCLLLVCLLALPAGCVRRTTMLMAPSLAPVDLSRPIVRYKAIQGQACGDDALLRAVWDMKRLDGPDGYVEVVAEREKRCVTVTGHPFTYGTEVQELRLRRRDPPPTPAPATLPAAPTPPAPPEPPATSAAPSLAVENSGPLAAAPPPAPSGPAPPPPVAAPARDCNRPCESFALLAGSSDFIRGLVTRQCADRCSRGDAAYMRCVESARVTPDVKKCNALPAGP